MQVGGIVHSKKWELVQVEKQIVAIAMATKFKIEKFNEVNFSIWKLRIKVILRKDNCLVAIKGVRPPGVTNDKWKEMDDNAMANLHLVLADLALSSVAKNESAKEIWCWQIQPYLNCTRSSHFTIRSS